MAEPEIIHMEEALKLEDSLTVATEAKPVQLATKIRNNQLIGQVLKELRGRVSIPVNITGNTNQEVADLIHYYEANGLVVGERCDWGKMQCMIVLRKLNPIPGG